MHVYVSSNLVTFVHDNATSKKDGRIGGSKLHVQYNGGIGN